MSDLRVRTDFPRRTREIENIWIPMPDGVRLAARIWLPEDAEADPVPAILEYLPYRKRDGTVVRDHLTHPYFAGHGYAGVRVDMRGTGDSEGVCRGEYLQQEQDDALAVIAWLAAQPWCTGYVGMIGISWGGFNGLQLAALRPPALKAVITLCSTDDRYADDIHFFGGAVLTDKLAWGATAFSIAMTPPDPAIVGDRWRAMWEERLTGNGLWFLDWMRHQRRDEFYAHGSVCERYEDIEIPVYAVGGWVDGYTNPIFRMMEHLSCPRKALIGPWAHAYPHFAQPGPRIGFLQECLRWWDQHLKGAETGIMDEPMIRAWVQDPAPPGPEHTTRPGRWVAEPGFAAPGPKTFSLFPGPHGLRITPQTGEVAIASPENAGWTAPLWCAYGVVPDGALDQNGEAGLTQTLQSPPIDGELDLLGFPILTAKVTSDQPQANLIATLSAIDEAGRATLISFGALNLCHRNSHADPQPLPVGEAAEIRLQLNACGQRIGKGQRLRLGLATASWPLIWPAPAPANLILTDMRLDLPARPPSTEDGSLTPFEPPEAAAPLEIEVLSPPSYDRARTIDCVTGIESHERINDSGRRRHADSGTVRRDRSEEVFCIHPADPATATGRCAWLKSYERADWSASVEAEIEMAAKADHWRVTARLVAKDDEEVVADISWDETIPRDFT